MNEERRRILQLVADGRITAEEAADLLDALTPEPRHDQPASNMSLTDVPMPPKPPRPAGRPRALVIQVQEGNSDRVNLRIPFGLVGAAGRFIPRKAQQHLRDHGIELDELTGDLSGSDYGTVLEVQDGDDRVLIAVE